MGKRVRPFSMASKRIVLESLAKRHNNPSNPVFRIRSLNDIKYQNQNTSTSKCGQIQESKPEVTTFHTAISRTLVVCQCFGILPVNGVTDADARTLTFSFWSLRVALAVILLSGCLFIEALSVVHMIAVLKSDEASFMVKFGSATPGVVFYGNACVATILFLRLASKWPTLMEEWNNMENSLGTNDLNGNLSLKVNTFVGVIMSLALVEHLLSTMVNTPELLNPDSVFPSACPLENAALNNATVISTSMRIFKSYCCHSHRFIFSTIHFSLWSGLVIFVCSKIATFTWNFQDLFVILISVALVERFKQMNARVLSTAGKYLRQNEWGKLREDFATLASLVKSVDNEISGIVMLSFCNNLYFICLQLLNGISPNIKGWVQTTYFFGSFLFLLARAISVTMYAAGIHDHAKVGLPALYQCPSESYCVEVQRLHTQLAFDDCALTGLKFFLITRNFMLAVAGAIFTYEVVLIQFK